MIGGMSRVPADPRLEELARLRRVRDRIDRDYAQPHRRDAAAATQGMPACVAKQVTKPIRNREAPAAVRS